MIKTILDDSCEESRQQISFAKSKVLFSNNVSSDRQNILTNILNIPKTNKIWNYLGCPIFHDRPSKQDFQMAINNVNVKLAAWKSKLLPLAAKNILIKSVNSTIPTHVMQSFVLQKYVALSLDKINRDFLWGSSIGKRKIHAVK